MILGLGVCAYSVLYQETNNPFLLASLKDYLESIFQCPVDVIRMHKNMNPLLKSRIERDGIYAIR